MNYLPEVAMTTARSGAILSVLNIIGSILMMPVLPFILVLIALVLYYFTGEKKRADEFMPKLMAQLIRIFSYTWLLIVSVGAFVGVTQVLYYVFANILPAPRYLDEVDSEILVKGIVLLTLMAGFAAAKIMLNRYSVRISKVGGSVSTKVFVGFGMMIFSILLFTSSIATFMNIVDFFYDQDLGIDSNSVALMFSSLGFFLLYLLKGVRVLNIES